MSIQLEQPKVGVEGHVTFTVMRKGKVRFHSEFKNTVLNQFFDAPLMPQDDLNSYAFITDYLSYQGTARFPIYRSVALGAEVTTPPLETDQGLNNEIAFRGTSSDGTTVGVVAGVRDPILGAVNDYIFQRIVSEFPEGTATGNLTEVGLKGFGYVYGDPTKTTINRVDFKTLIKDASGNPVTVPVTALDRVIVGYEIRAYRPPFGVTGPFTLHGNTGEFKFVTPTYFYPPTFYDLPYTEWATGRGSSTYDLLANTGCLAAIGGSYRPSPSMIHLLDGRPEKKYVLPADSVDRIMGPTVISTPEIRLNGTETTLTTSTVKLAEAPNTPTKVTNSNGPSRVLGVFVDATTDLPRDVFIPMGYKLEFTLNQGDTGKKWTDFLTRRT